MASKTRLPHTRFAISLLFLPTLAFGGAWPLSPGSGKATVGASWLSAASVIDAEGKKRAYAMREAGLSTYGEAGLWPRVSLGWAWGFYKHVASDSADAHGVTDPELSLSWHLGRSGAFIFALQGLAQFPLGPENPSSVPDFAPAFFSQRASAAELRPLLGWAGGGWWAQGGAGVRARSEGLAWQFRYTAAAGRAFGRVSGLFAMDGVVPLDAPGSGKPGDQDQYYGYHLGLDFRLSKAWQAGAQFDSMLTLGQELPLGARLNGYLRFAWK